MELGPKTHEKLIKSLFLFPTWNRWGAEDFELSFSAILLQQRPLKSISFFIADVSQERRQKKSYGTRDVQR